MPIPVPVPGTPLLITDPDTVGAELLVSLFTQIVKNGTTGATLNTPGTQIPNPSINPVGLIPLVLSAAEQQSYIRQLAVALRYWAVNGGIPSILKGTATLDFPSIPATSQSELTITVTGATVGDAVALGPPSGLEADLAVVGYVSAANTVTVRLLNNTALAIDPASASWTATVMRG